MGKTPIKSEKKNKEFDIALTYAALNIGLLQPKNYGSLKSIIYSGLDISRGSQQQENEALLKSLLNKGIEKIPALILTVAGSRLWNPKQQVTMTHVKNETIEHDYAPITDAYDYFQGKGYTSIESAFLVAGYVNNMSSSLETFERKFRKNKRSLRKLLE